MTVNQLLDIILLGLSGELAEVARGELSQNCRYTSTCTGGVGRVELINFVLQMNRGLGGSANKKVLTTKVEQDNGRASCLLTIREGPATIN